MEIGISITVLGIRSMPEYLVEWDVVIDVLVFAVELFDKMNEIVFTNYSIHNSFIYYLEIVQIWWFIIVDQYLFDTFYGHFFIN